VAVTGTCCNRNAQLLGGTAAWFDGWKMIMQSLKTVFSGTSESHLGVLCYVLCAETSAIML